MAINKPEIIKMIPPSMRHLLIYKKITLANISSDGFPDLFL
jgi:hypothetical protein